MNMRKSCGVKEFLGEEGPNQLHDTVLFLLGMNLALRAGDEHYDLRRPCDSKTFTIIL